MHCEPINYSNDNVEQVRKEYEERNAELERLLCIACSLIIDLETLAPWDSASLSTWWKQHKQNDKARKLAAVQQLLTEIEEDFGYKFSTTYLGRLSGSPTFRVEMLDGLRSISSTRVRFKLHSLEEFLMSDLLLQTIKSLLTQEMDNQRGNLLALESSIDLLIEFETEDEDVSDV